MASAESSTARSEALVDLVRGSLSLGIDLSDDQTGRFEAYLNTLLLWRSRLSLTAAATPVQIVRRHILDSLHGASFIRPGFRVADLGSGAGFPGIPLAIVCPQSTLVLIESRRKRANFLRETARRARLANVDVAEERAEALGGHFDLCDIVVSRAVGPVPEFLDVAVRLLRPGGLAIAMKGPAALTESLPQSLEFLPPQLEKYRLHGGVQRALIVYRKR